MSARPIRVCLVGSFPADAAGYPNVGEFLARRFEADGHRVITVSRRRSRAAKLWDILWTLWSRRRHYDVVVVEVFSTAAIWYAVAASGLARRLDKRVIASLHGGGLPRLARAGDRRLGAILDAAEVVTAPSPYLQREVGGPLGRRIEVVPNPVDVGDFPRRVRTGAGPRLLWLRAFRRLYLPEVAVRVVALLRAAHPDVRLTMAGPDRDGSLGDCRALARSLGVEEAVSFPGLVDARRIRALGDASDIFLNTTSVDNTPLSVIEALAMGLCVVSTDVGGLPDLLEDGQDALLVPPGAPERMAEAVGRLLAEPRLAEKLSRNALASADRFEIGRVVETWYGILAGRTEGNG